MAIYIDIGLKDVRAEQKTGGTKPGRPALPCHREGRGVAFAFQHEDVLWSNTNRNGGGQTPSFRSLHCKTEGERYVKK